MEETSLEFIHQKLLDEQAKLKKSITTFETLVNPTCIKISGLIFADKFWLDAGYSHLKQGYAALLNAINTPITMDMVREFADKLKQGEVKNEGNGHDARNESADKEISGQ